MRPIDADSLMLRLQKKKSTFFDRKLTEGFNDAILRVRSMVHSEKTVDPESLPVVQELRKELERVTAELDAAVSDLENIMAYNSDTCKLCKNRQCYVRGGIKPCLPKWRGPDGDHP